MAVCRGTFHGLPDDLDILRGCFAGVPVATDADAVYSCCRRQAGAAVNVSLSSARRVRSTPIHIGRPGGSALAGRTADAAGTRRVRRAGRVLVATVVFFAEARRRGAVNDQSLVAVTGALVGGAIGMRLSGWAEHIDVRLNPTLLQAWEFGSRSILAWPRGRLRRRADRQADRRLPRQDRRSVPRRSHWEWLSVASAVTSPKLPAGRPACRGVCTPLPPRRNARVAS
ncbi:hypothetical protein LAUMK13_04069 [Mycobacterium innocens]|uniref:Uncharacterized protein n=1 Tax=Mycobacterium innocens TaxID=2341083 RepID=A0A498QB37_9MYCO|nr:hypothetical protein LAUMK13_04069 [Mycobacterium innocens]